MPSSNNKTDKARRHDEAVARQAKYDALTIDQKVALASTRPGNSEKEITRLGVKAGIYPSTIREDRKRLHPAKGTSE